MAATAHINGGGKEPVPDKAVAELCKRHFEDFVREFWDIIISEKLVWEDHMSVLCDEIQTVYDRVFLQTDPNDKNNKIRLPKLYDLIINIPPGTTKSTIVTIMAPAWAWTRDPTLRIITASYSNDLATEHSVKSRDIITSDKYRMMFPEVQIKDDKGLKTNYETTANGQRFATSVGGTATGVHAHVKVVDDPLNPLQAASQTECKNTNAWNDGTLSQRNVDNEITVSILIMQRLAVNDLTGHILQKKKDNVRHICLPGELSDIVSPVEYRKIYKNGLLCPKRLNVKVLQEKRKDLGSIGYAGQISQRPAPEGGTIWGKYFQEIDDIDFPTINQATEVGTDWDLAYTKEQKNSASAYITTGMIGENIFIFDFDWEWLEFPELIKWMKSKRAPHYIEAKASGKSAKQTLKQHGIVAVEVKINGDKIARAKDATPTAESGIVYIKRSLADRLYNDPKQGILFFPNGEYNDVADVLSQAITRRVKKGKLYVGDSRNAPIDYYDDEIDGAQVIEDNLLDYI